MLPRHSNRKVGGAQRPKNISQANWDKLQAMRSATKPKPSSSQPKPSSTASSGPKDIDRWKYTDVKIEREPFKLKGRTGMPDFKKASDKVDQFLKEHDPLFKPYQLIGDKNFKELQKLFDTATSLDERGYKATIDRGQRLFELKKELAKTLPEGVNCNQYDLKADEYKARLDNAIRLGEECRWTRRIYQNNNKPP